ncbi:hypothetical protein LSAT2_012897 [Lamellibrachia satsuma]|nr:hypothetical protein LSAT2_012897 [Lamellibrachia satsuma]
MSSLPDYVRNLHSYAWKPFIIERALRNHSAIFWIDSSFRLMGTDLTDTYRTAVANGGIVLFIRTDHSNYVATHPDMYCYLVTDVEAQKTIEQFGTGAILIYRTEKVFRQVLWWFYLCSLERRCLQPIANRFCRLDPKDRYATHAHCHRFDQAIVNLLLSNIWLTDGTPYTAKEDFFKIHRYVTNMYNVKVASVLLDNISIDDVKCVRRLGLRLQHRVGLGTVDDLGSD